MKIRTGNMSSLAKGARAEDAVQQWFEARGHKCVNVGKEGLMHDLEVGGYGRVQVKSCRKERHDSQPWRIVCRLSQGTTGARYPEGAFEWLACVYWLVDGPRVWLVSESKLRSPNGPYLRDKYKIAPTKACLLWSAIGESEALVA